MGAVNGGRGPGKKNVTHLTFKCAYNAVKSKHNSCTMPIHDTGN
jgi:hypothetical protein